jgi:hypothetical protein
MHAQTPVQIAWVTTDLTATEGALTTLLDFVASISFSYAGDAQLELICPISGENVYTEFLDRAGPGLHHVCVEVDDVDAAVGTAEVLQRGVMPGGMEFAYVTAEAAGVPYIEIAHIPPEIRAFFDYVKQEQQ